MQATLSSRWILNWSGQVGEASADEVRLGMEQMKQKFIEEGKQLYKEV